MNSSLNARLRDAKSSRTTKLSALNVALIFFLVALLCGIGGTFAALTNIYNLNNLDAYPSGKLINSGENSMTTAYVGQSWERSAIAKNEGSQKMYARMKIEKKWQKNTGTDTSPTWEDLDSTDPQLNPNYIDVVLNDSSDWVYDVDGYYYYTKAIDPGQSSTSLMRLIRLRPDIGEGSNDNTYRDGTIDSSSSDYVNFMQQYIGKAATVSVTLDCTSQPINKVSVAFNTKGGSNVEGQTIAKGGKATKPANPLKSGCIFAGWYSDDACTTSFDFNKELTQDVVVYAKWTDEHSSKHTVTFYTQGGNPTPDPQAVEHGSTATKPLTSPSKTGYIFGGWYRDADCKQSYNFDSAITSSTAIYARWIEDTGSTKTATISFNTGGGTTIPEQIVVLPGKAERPSDPTKEGYTFGGWYSDESLAEEFSFSSSVSGDTTLYAKWITSTDPLPSHVVKFNTDGGTNVDDQIVEAGSCATDTIEPTKSGSKFGGWYADESLAKPFSFSSPITSATDVYAKWYSDTTDLKQVTFDTKGGTAISKIYVENGGTIERPADPVKANYEFAGWYKDASCVSEFTFDEEINSDITIYANWVREGDERPVHTVTFHANGGSPDNQITNAKSGDAITEVPIEPVRVNSVFAGWYSDKALTNPFNTTGAITSKTDVYAKWVASPTDVYKVSFNTHGGTSVSDIYVESGKPATRPDDPSRGGYSFGGWYIDDAYTQGIDFNSISSNTTVHAKWLDLAAVTHLVTFETNGGSVVASQTVDNGSLVARPGDPSMSGYTFAGWFADEGLTTPWDFAAMTISTETTIFAKWTMNKAIYEVTFDSKGGSSVPSQFVEEGGFATKPADPQRDGYTFAGWYRSVNATQVAATASSDGATASVNSVTEELFDFTATPILASTNLVAHWTPQSSVIPTDNTSGENAISSVVSTGGSAYTTPSGNLAQTGDDLPRTVYVLYAICAIATALCILFLIIGKRRSSYDKGR